MRLTAGLLTIFVIWTSAAAQQTPADKIKSCLQKETRKLLNDITRIINQEIAARLPAVQNAIRIISDSLLERHVYYLASDKLAGRRAGTKGCRLAGDYIAKEFAKLGLKPVGDKDKYGRPTYFQKFKIGRKKKTRNVLGLLEGSHPKLKHQIIVVGAHYDHIGKGKIGWFYKPKKDDDIWNGADDNASGTSAVLVLARAFVKSGVKPRRSILFILFGAEERGLVGSRKYLKNPPFSLKNHVAMVNFDMIGRNPDKEVKIYGTGSAEEDYFVDILKHATQKTGLRIKMVKTSFMLFGSSDHASFIYKKIPSLFFFTGLHRDYHGVDDEPDRLDYERMERITETGFYTIFALANAKERPKFSKRKPWLPAFTLEDEEDFPRPKRKLGIIPAHEVEDEEIEKLGLAEKQSAVKVEEVFEDSVASRAGLKPGDWIIEFDGKKFKRGRELRDLARYISDVKPKKVVKIKIIRNKKIEILKAIWDK